MKKIYFFVLMSISLSLHSQPLELQVESNHSTIGFQISISGFSVVTGKFMDFEILMDWDSKNVENCNVHAIIKAESITTGIKERDDHLRTSDFFDVEKYPTIEFISDSIRQIDYSNFIAFGKFSMHGTTKEIRLPFRIVKMEGNTLGFSSRTKLNRQDYGVGSGFKHTSMPDFLADDIDVQINFWTKKRKKTE